MKKTLIVLVVLIALGAAAIPVAQVLSQDWKISPVELQTESTPFKPQEAKKNTDSLEGSFILTPVLPLFPK